MKLTLKYLQECHPAWVWTARREGFGWCYRGRKLGSCAPPVTFRAYSIADQWGDHARTEWRSETESYALWSTRNFRV